MPAALWLKTGTNGYRGQSRAPIDWDSNGEPRTDIRDGNGRLVRDRVPALGYEGSDIHNMRPIKGIRRYVDFLKQDGHVVHVPITNAAAHIPNEDQSCRRDRFAKAKYFGWIEWASTGVSKCPCVMLLAGEINVEQLRSQACKGSAHNSAQKAEEAAGAAAWRGKPLSDLAWWGKPCDIGSLGNGKPPCIHAIAERLVRRAIRAKEDKEREIRATSPEALAAQAQAVAATKQTTALEALAEKQGALTEVLAEKLTPRSDKR